ncbi:MAG: hypothetical protein OHK0019_08700 [Saprospiraceae bacterium]
MTTSQTPAFLELSDSIVFEGRQGYFFKNGNGISNFDAGKGLIRHYDMNGALVDSIRIDPTYLLKEKGNFHPALFWAHRENLILLNTVGYTLDFFSKTGHYLFSRKLDLKHKGSKYFIGDEQPPFYPLATENTLLLPVHRTWKGYEGSALEFMEGGRTRYEQPGIIGEFDLEGNLVKVFGLYDSVYRQGKLLTYLDEYSLGSIGQDSIFVSFQLGDKIAVYHKGVEKEPIASRGAYFNRESKDLFAITSREEIMEDNPKYPIETPHYFDCVVVGNYLVRTYAIAIQDTVRFTDQELEVKKKWARGELKGCKIKTKHDYEQGFEYRSKPCFVQIFDLKQPQFPVYDGQIPLGFPMCLGMRGKDEFLFTSYFRPEHGQAVNQVIYYFRLKTIVQH